MLLCLWGRLPAVCCLCVGVTWPPVLMVYVRLVLCTVVGGGRAGWPSCRTDALLCCLHWALLLVSLSQEQCLRSAPGLTLCPGGSPFSLFILFMGFSRQEY